MCESGVDKVVKHATTDLERVEDEGFMLCYVGVKNKMKGVKINKNELRKMVKKIKSYLAMFQSYKVQFTKRDDNKVAHYPSKQALLEGNKTWLEEVPMFIRDQICNDIYH